MVLKAYNFLERCSKSMGRVIMRVFYSYVSFVDKDNKAIFLNYGYHKNRIKLEFKDEKNRYCIQLYNHIASSAKLKDKIILEIGCGRGGGCYYISRYFKPKKIIGLDLCKRAIKFNEKFYSEENLSFIHGNSMNLPFPNNSFDILINVESSHGYKDFPKFLSEVKRVLKSGGLLLFADFRHKEDIKEFEKDIKNSGMKIIKSEDITKNVIVGLKLDNKRRQTLIEKLIPMPLRDAASQFAGVRGSELYNSFISGKRKYLYFVLKKAF